MRHHIGFACLYLLLLPLLALSQSEKPKKNPLRQMAITINELPAAPDFSEVDPNKINHMLLQALKKHSVKATGFVVGTNLNSEYDIIGEWLNDGHTIGSMTYDAEDINELGAEKFIEDAQSGIDEIEDMLQNFGQKKRYFRFPYLHYGTTREDKKLLKSFFHDKGCTIAHASITPSDDLYNFSLGKMGKILDSMQYVVLRDEYFNYMLDEIERSEALAEDIMGRPVKHVLMLRANRLNAIYLDELLTVLEDDGWSFITLDAALRDAVYSRPENYLGLRGVGYLDMIAQSEK